VSTESPIQIDLPRAIELLAADERLVRLKHVLTRFNIFDAVGPRWKELDHSACLAFLLSPYETHGLGDTVLRTFLQKADDATGEVGPVPADMTAAMVETEVHHVDVKGVPGRIDILVLDEANKLAIIIENKTGTREHDEQLRRYRAEVHSRCGDQWRIVALYLSPGAEKPSQPDWVEVGYRQICEALRAVASEHGLELDAGVRVLLDHYADFIRRKLVGDDDIDRLCRRTYAQHEAAIYRISRHVGERRKQVRGLIERLVKQTPNFDLDDPPWDDQVRYRALFIRVAYLPWDKDLDRHGGNGRWTKSRRLLLFTFNVFYEHVDMNLMIGPGDARERERLLRMAGHAPLDHAETEQHGTSLYTSVYRDTILTVDQWADSSDAELEGHVRSWWNTFTTKIVPAIDAQVREYVLGGAA
jgi:hypothetical protein